MKLTVHDMQLCCGLMFDSDWQFVGLLYNIHLPLPFQVKSPDHIYMIKTCQVLQYSEKPTPQTITQSHMPVHV